MEEAETDFIQDFSLCYTTGEIANKNSKIKQVGENTYISIDNKINLWNTRDSKIIISLKTLKKNITFLDEKDGVLMVGYNNGSIQLFSENTLTFRPHFKRVTCIVKKDNYVISASADGSVILYDIVMESVKKFYKDNSVFVDGLVIFNDLILAYCADSIVRIWEIEEENIKEVHVFEKQIKSIISFNQVHWIFFNDGESIIYNFETKESKPSHSHKKIKNVKIFDNNIYVHCKKKIYIYEKKSDLSVKNVEILEINEKYIDFDKSAEGLIFITAENGWENIIDGKKYSFSHHMTEIKAAEIVDDKVITLSNEKIIIWYLLDNMIERMGCIDIQNSENMVFWNDLIIVTGFSGFNCYSIETYDLVREEKIGKTTAVAKHKDFLAVATEKFVFFYDAKFKKVKTLETEELILSLGFSDNSEVFAVGIINSKIYLYDHKDFKLKTTLYGHSLPVKSMIFSPDATKLLTCGADKLVKLWGTKFGECLKTFIGDSNGAQFLTDDLFIVSSGTMHYYRKHDLIKEFKKSQSNLLKIKDDILISCGKHNIDLYKKDKYEFCPEESTDEEDEVIREARIVNYKMFDRILLNLESLENDFSEINIRCLYNTLLEADLSELDRYLCVLTSENINQLLNFFIKSVDWNVVLAARLFIIIVKFHKSICVSHPKFSALLKEITNGISAVREQISSNEAFLLLWKDSIENDMAEELLE